jgi:hypothetical protein
MRSKALWQYLEDRGILNGSAEDIAQAKAEYRKEYKRAWKTTNTRKNKFILIKLNKGQYSELCKRARLYNQNPTKYASEVILTAQENRNHIPHRPALLTILQEVGIAITYNKSGNKNEVDELLLQAEKKLLEYLNKPL